MKKPSFIQLGFALALVLCASLVHAGDKNVTVKFPKGASSTTLKGSVKGYDTTNYILGVSKGQAISILFKPSNDSCYFNVFAPGADEALFIGSQSASSNEYSGNLMTSGNYKAQVYMMRNEARRGTTCSYSITFEITG